MAAAFFARSATTSWFMMRNMSSTVLPFTRYLPATMKVGVLGVSPLVNAPRMYYLPRLTLAATAKLCMLLTNCFGSAP